MAYNPWMDEEQDDDYDYHEDYQRDMDYLLNSEYTYGNGDMSDGIDFDGDGYDDY